MEMKEPVKSYIRHVIVVAIVALAAKLGLPEEGISDFAQGLALMLIGTATWAIVKYAPPGLRKFIGLAAIGLIAGFTFTGCAGVTGSLSTPWGHVDHAHGDTAYYPPAILFSSK